VLAHRFEPMRTGHAERLFPMIAEGLAEASLAIGDIDRIAVTHGPGTFTGTRISVAAARALAVALPGGVASFSSLHVMGLRALELLRRGTADQQQQPADTDFRLVVVRPPRRGAYDGQVFDCRGSPICEPMAGSAERFFPLLEGSRRFLVAGPGADEFLPEASGRMVDARAAAVAPPGEQHIPQDTEPDARYLLGLAAAHTTRILEGVRPRPLYLRPADAKPSMKPGIARTS